MSNIDFRTEIRTPTNVFVNVIVSDEEHYLSRATNISSRGMHVVKLPEHRDEVRFVWLLFWLPNSDELIRALGEVVHSRGTQHLDYVGFKFKYVSPKHRRVLDHYLGARGEFQVNISVAA